MAENYLLKQLMHQRGEATSAARTFAERAAEGADLSAEDQAAFERAVSEDERLKGLIDQELRRVEDDARYNEAVEKAFRSAVPGEKRTEEKREVTLGQRMRNDLEASRRGESRSGGLYLPIPEQRISGSGIGFTTGQADTVQGNIVPETLVSSLYRKLQDDSAVLSLGPTVLRTEGGEEIKLPRLTGRGALSQSNSRVPEAETILATNDPAFDQVSLSAYKYAQIMQVSRELVEDGVLDIESLLGEVLGQNLANYLGTDLTNGTGTGQPNGVRTLVPSGNKVDTEDGGLWDTADFDRFFNVVAKLKPAHRANAKWVCNDASVFNLRKLKMGNLYAWEPNLQSAGMPDRFLGYPVHTDPNIPVPAASAGVTMLFGDFSKYYVRFVRDVRVEWSMEHAWQDDVISVKAVVRVDGDAIDADAFAALNSKS